MTDKRMGMYRFALEAGFLQKADACGLLLQYIYFHNKCRLKEKTEAASLTQRLSTDEALIIIGASYPYNVAEYVLYINHH